MTKKLYCFFLILLLTSCGGTKSKLYDLTPLYQRVLEKTSVDTTLDMAQMQADISEIYRANLYTLSNLTVEQSNKEIANLSKKMRNTNNKKMATLYSRELNFYKPLFYENNYFRFRLNDIPLQYRKPSDKISDENAAIIELDDYAKIVNDKNVVISGKCINSIYKVVVLYGGREIDGIEYSSAEELRQFHFIIDTSKLALYNNELTVRAFRFSKEFYDIKYNVYILPNDQSTVEPNENGYTVNTTDKTSNYNHTFYEIDLTKRKNDLNYYSLIDKDGLKVGFEHKIINDEFHLFLKIGEQLYFLFIEKDSAKKNFALKHYTNGDIILEYYTGFENYTDYIVYTNGEIYRASDLAKQNDLSGQMIFTKVNDAFVLADYEDNDKLVRFYYFDSNLKLQTIIKKQTDKFLYKTFSKDEIYYNL